MAAPWLLLVLVVLVWSWPGSSAGSVPQHLCGANLVEALFTTCGDRGFYEHGRRGAEPLGVVPLKVGGAPVGGASVGGGPEELTWVQVRRRLQRSIVAECCHSPCTSNTLQKYCN